MAAVPKFGEWDTGNDTNLFTAKFDMARSERSNGSSKQGVGRGNERLGYGDGRANEGLVHGIGRGGRSGDRGVGGGGGRRIMNPNDPLENPDAFFGNRGIKPSNMSHENNQHDSGFPVMNGQLRSSRTSAPPAKNATPSPTSRHNRFKQPSPSATPPRARVNPSGIPANLGRPALPKFGEWDEEAEGFSSVFKDAAAGQTTQFGVDDDVGRNYRRKKSYHNDAKGTHKQSQQSYFCRMFRRKRK